MLWNLKEKFLICLSGQWKDWDLLREDNFFFKFLILRSINTSFPTIDE